MILSALLSTLLLTGLLIWFKNHLFNDDNQEAKTRIPEVAFIAVISFAFVGAQFLINLTEKSESIPSSYLSPETKYKIGLAFYLGQDLPKDDRQALNWLLMASNQGSKNADALLTQLGYQGSGSSTGSNSANASKTKPSFAIEIIPADKISTQFSDIAGMKEAKQEVIDTIDFLKNPEKFTRLGASPPKGILIYGPSGTGKTLMARAIAGEAHVTFISVSGAAFDEKYVGIGAQRVRELFNLARKNKPCVVFIDEIDALLPERVAGQTTGRDQTVNQFLSEMDNVQNDLNSGIIFVGATNRLDILDPAALRPGRFDRKIYFRLPSAEEREMILKLLLQKVHYASDVDIKTLANITAEYSGAELANLINEAAIDATLKNKPAVDMKSFEEANDKIALGLNQGSGSYTALEKKITAYHEAGHALVGILHPDHPRVFHKMSIGLRDNSLGVTHFRQENDLQSLNKKQIEAMISTALAGYIAEEMIFGKDNVTTGAASDLVSANKMVRDMVTKYAMADDQSLLMPSIFLGSEGNLAEEAEKILQRDYAVAKDILEKNRDKLDLIAKTLLKQETLDYQEIVGLLNLSNNPPKP